MQLDPSSTNKLPAFPPTYEYKITIFLLSSLIKLKDNFQIFSNSSSGYFEVSEDNLKNNLTTKKPPQTNQEVLDDPSLFKDSN